MKTVVVVDRSWIGHVPEYHRGVLEAIIDAGYTPISITPSPESEFTQIGITRTLALSRIQSIRSAKIFYWELRRKLTFNKEKRQYLRRAIDWLKLAELIRRTVADYGLELEQVFLPYLEGMWWDVGCYQEQFDTFFDLPWSGITIHPLEGWSSQRPNEFNFRNSVHLTKSTQCRRLFLLNEFLFTPLQNILPKTKVTLLPESDFHQIPPHQDAREMTLERITKACHDYALHPMEAQRLHWPADGTADTLYNWLHARKVVMLSGNIGMGKQPLLLLETARAAAQDLNLAFLVIGSFDRKWMRPDEYEAILAQLQHLPPNVFWLTSSRIAPQVLMDFLAVGDIAWCMYENFPFPSNILVKAARSGKRAIVNAHGWNEIIVRRYRLGSIVAKNFPCDCLSAIRETLNSCTSPDIGLFEQEHNGVKFKRELAQFFKENIGPRGGS